MIYTLTLNPSIDYIIGVDNIEYGKVNRTSYEKILPGGKTFEDGGREVDSFIVRTLDRISVAWGMCREEFSLASSAAVKESQKIIKQEVEKQTEKAVEKITESAKEAVRESLP